jgi:hypothetical protein
MSNEPPRRLIEIGTFPSGFDATFIDGRDPVAVALDDATARLDAEKAEAERTRLAQAADVERVQRTKRAKVMRKLGKVLKMVARMR